jgi:hypothetical protein
VTVQGGREGLEGYFSVHGRGIEGHKKR